MNTFIDVLKRKLLENIVFVVIMIGFFIYLVLDGAVAEIGFIIIFPPWLVFAFSSFSVLFDWKLLKYFRLWILVSFILGSLAIALLFYLGWRKDVYVYVAGAGVIGFVLSIVEKVFSIGRR